MLCPGNPRAQCCKRRAAHGDLGGNSGGDGGGRHESNFSKGANNECYKGELTLTVLKDAPKPKQKNQLKKRDHKTENVCDVKNTKKNKVFILKQMYKENSVSSHVTIQFH